MTAPSPPPRDPLVEVAEKIAEAADYDPQTDTGRKFVEQECLPILRAFVEEREKDRAKTLALLQSNLAKAEASLDDERRLRATACKLADERERERDQARDERDAAQQERIEARTDRSQEAKYRIAMQRERDTARAEAAALASEIEDERESNSYTRMERDRAQERLREAEGLIRDEVLPRYCELYEAMGLGDVSGSVAVNLMRKFLAHPDEQPAAPAAEPLEPGCECGKGVRCPLHGGPPEPSSGRHVFVGLAGSLCCYISYPDGPYPPGQPKECSKPESDPVHVHAFVPHPRGHTPNCVSPGCARAASDPVHQPAEPSPEPHLLINPKRCPHCGCMVCDNCPDKGAHHAAPAPSPSPSEK